MPIEVARQAESIARCGSRRVVPMPICLHAKANAAHASAMAAPLRRVYIHWVTPAGGSYVGVGTAAHQATLVCVVSVYTPQGTCVSWLDTAHGACTAHKLFSLFSS